MTPSELYAISQYWFPPPPSQAVTWNELREVPSSSGVYFLYKGCRAVYVGESLDIRRRLRRHEHKAKSETISWIKCDASSRKRLESFYIAVLDPALNSQSSHAASESARRSSSKRSLPSARRIFAFIYSHPGCSKTQIYRASTRNRKSLDMILRRLAEWRFVVVTKKATEGRPLTLYFPAKTPAHSDSLIAEV